MNQTLNVIPQGLIESGNVAYSAEPSTGLIEWQESIVAGIGPFTKTDSHGGALTVDKALLLSKSIIPGLKLVIGDVTVTISETRTIANIEVSGDDKELSGLAQLNLDGEFLSIHHIILSGTVNGSQINLELAE